jgi:glycerol-3-phosphate dehydrogenase
MGPWTDQVIAGPTRLRLSRGTHVLVPGARLPLQHAVAFFAPQDGRPLFARPAGLRGWPATLIGTTEVEHEGAPDDVQPSRAEVGYLMEAAASAFPAWGLRLGDVAHAYAGVRPLERTSRGAGRADRRYVARWEEPGLLTLWGGKLTLALEGARLALRRLGDASRMLGLPRVVVPAWGTLAPLDEIRTASWSPSAVSERLRVLGVGQASVAHLVATHGARTGELLWLIERDRSLREPIVRGAPHLLAEAAYAQQTEMALSPGDFLSRRSQLGLWLACARRSETIPTAFSQLWPSPGGHLDDTAQAFRHDTRP